RLSSADRSALRQWGQVGKWDLRRDSRLTVEFNGRTHRGRLAVGLTFLLFCGEIARAEAASGTIWPPIYEAFGKQQREFLFAQEASPKLWLPIGTALMFQEELLWTPTIQREDGPIPIKASLTEGR